MMMDTIVLSAKVKCTHDGCQSYVSYHDLDDHQSMCPCAPCFCTEPGCGFVSLPLTLLSHLTTQHSWPIHNIEYGKELRLQVPVSEPRHLLLGEEDDGVFLLVMGAVGQSTATAVSLVRIGACPVLQPRYMLNILAYLPPAVASRRAHMLLLDMDVESSTRPGEVVVEELPSYLTVPPTYLVGAGASKEVSLDIRIDKIIS
jgi:E3 ubiquitin-protein ligase SIAH1